MNDQFTHLERSVIDMLLPGELPAVRTLQQQFADSRPVSRELTGVGFFTHFLGLEISMYPSDLEQLARARARKASRAH